MTPKASIKQRPSRTIQVGSCAIGGASPIAVQSMCATKTADIPRTLEQIHLLERAGAHLIRVAVDSRRDVEALAEIRKETSANLVVDLQEAYHLAEFVAPLVQKMRYNPGHLHHSRPGTPIKDKVRLIVDAAGAGGCALRIGVNFGSLDPALREEGKSREGTAVDSALEHCELLESFGFCSYLVSLKSSDPHAVVAINRIFAAQRPDVPLHLGVTEAGMPPAGEWKTRIALETLLREGIGDTIRVSLTLPDDQKNREIEAALEIIRDVESGRVTVTEQSRITGLNVISCPSCSRVENKAFVNLARQVKDALIKYQNVPLSVAVMGCRVNGPGETDEADLGLWCAPSFVNLKKGASLIGKFTYEEVLGRLLEEVEEVAKSRMDPGTSAEDQK